MRTTPPSHGHFPDGLLLGEGTITNAKERVYALAQLERERLEQANTPAIVELQVELGFKTARLRELEDIIRLSPSPASASRGQRYWYGFAAVLLMAGGASLAHFSLSPFGIGWEAWIMALAFSILTGITTDLLLEKCRSESLVKSLCAIAFFAGMVGVIVLSMVRGDVMLFEFQSVVNESSEAGQRAGVDFYRSATPLLCLFMIFLAVGMDLAAGLLIFEVRKLTIGSVDQAASARQERGELQRVIAALMGEIVRLTREPLHRELEIKRDFWLGVLSAMEREGLIRVSAIVLATVMLLSPVNAQAQIGDSGNARAISSEVVILLDVTQSVKNGPDAAKSEHAKNLESASALIRTLPPGTRITVLAITDQSFSRPLIMLKGEVPRDRGPLRFQDRIGIAKTRLAQELRRSTGREMQVYQKTDVFGALFVASDLFLNSRAAEKVLVIFSDMRHSANPIDLERPPAVKPVEALGQVRESGLSSSLAGITVHVLGVDGLGKTISYWRSLERFWRLYFKETGATLKTYSVNRELP